MKPLISAIPALLLSIAGSTTFAQVTDLISADRAHPVTPGMISGGQAATSSSPYHSRLDADVYKVGLPSETGGDFRAGGFVVYDDATFGGPYTDNTLPLVINGMAIGFVTPAVLPPVHGDHLYTRVSFYPDHDNTVPNSAYPYSGTPVVATIDWGAGWAGNRAPLSPVYYPTPITFNPPLATLTAADAFNGGPADRTAGVKIEVFADAAFTVRATEWAVLRRGAHNFLAVGSSDGFGWYSTGADAQQGQVENINRTGGAAAPNNRATFMGFQATQIGCGTPCFDIHTVGALTDGLTTISRTLLDNHTMWVRLTLAGPATDDSGASGQFLDIDTEGSSPALSIALYHLDSSAPTYGSLLLADTGSGSGNQSQLSFGIGRRAAVGDGRQYDGRGSMAGFRGLPAGDYIVAVAPAGSTFSDGFSVTPSGPGGPFTLRFRTNVNGTPAGASIAPPPETDLGTVIGAAFVGPVVVNKRDVRWVAFATPLSAGPDRPVTLSLEPGSMPSSSLTLFNSSGNVVASSVSLSPTPASPLVFDTVGSLPAGSYIAAITYGQRDLALSPATNGRWHARNTTDLTGAPFGLRIQTGWTNLCGSADFNGDGDIGTDLDIQDFFGCLTGNCCPTCWELGSDFNGDGDTGTDADIEAFFRVLAGANC